MIERIIDRKYLSVALFFYYYERERTDGKKDSEKADTA
jgi:hypothetical protein